MKTQLEHANLHVKDVNKVLAFLQAACLDFRIRHDSGEDDPERWVHIGNDDFYLAVYQATVSAEKLKAPYDGTPGINHLGFVVEDTELVRQRLLAAGFSETTIENHHPARRRIYFNDAEGNDWKFVQYFTEDPKQRNDYMHEMIPGLFDR